jgi:O-antigen ligase
MQWVRKIARGTAWFVAAGIVLLLFQSGLTSPNVPHVLRGIMASILFLSFVRPADGLLVAAALIPVATAGAQRFQVPGPWRWSEMLVLALVGGCLLHWSRNRPQPVGSDIRMPLLLFAMAVVASCFVQVAPSAFEFEPYRAELKQLVFANYLEASPTFKVVIDAALILEGLALFCVVVRLSATEPELRGRLARMIAIGAAAAAAINISTLIFASLRPGLFWSLFSQHIAGTRFNYHYGDVNAAGSYFALTILVAGGVTVARWHRVYWWIAAATIGLALWVTGSRMAMLAVFALIAVVLFLRAVRQRRAARLRAVAIAAVAVLLVVAGTSAMFLAHDTIRPTNEAFKARRELSMAALRAFQDSPLFGVGLSQYYGRSERYLPDWFRRSNLYFKRENAHNDYLQILAELGIVGLVGMICVLAAVARRLRSVTLPPMGVGVVAGVGAFILTSFGGHPLLTREVAYTFWLTLGLAATYGIPPVSSRSLWIIAATALAVVVVSVPFRVRSEMRTLPREHAAWGVSRWSPAESGPRIRSVGQRAVFFVPADARGVILPFRTRTESLGPHTIEIWFEGRLANRVTTKGAEWIRVNVVLPHAAAEGFYRVEARVTGPLQSGADPSIDAGVDMGWIQPTR